ncbi:ribonuclease HI [Candidatus Adlerbacteria bacterium RIFCSPHIGHO2_02_FULL_54_18]|uniref:Ribonuclease H n=2 Tax=Candidatus Adleribacteriota TaxID=1752736 RepID=A0A1F4Y3F4_9BACT|nr:MAG: ribonuclease HI [Candidatus Adlerbacteria bacterium RIFCSPLOWO2_01_FULL_54_21b]OGC88398.1 MAG: ribonuclease HI [Candidatus Adlerbacteria bacterium RIFCSPHIGHO2_02_FULL_54_18]
MQKTDRIVIFSDGASKGNPGPGGWAAVVVAGDTVTELGGFEKQTTNNRMELRAAIEGLRACNTAPAAVRVVYSDSSYVINGITKWVHGWKKNGWKTKEKKAVINQDLWQSLDATVAASGSEVDWQYVGGHVGVAGNERADAVASALAVGQKVQLYSGARASYGVAVSHLGADSNLQKNKSASSARAKAKAYSYVSRVDGKVLVHKTWAECEQGVRGKSARFKKALSAAEEKEIIAEFSAHK